jgi:hypothetical protein
MSMACSTHEEVINEYKLFVRRPEGKKPLLRHRHMWEDSIKTDLTEIGCKGLDRIHVAVDRVQLQALVK